MSQKEAAGWKERQAVETELLDIVNSENYDQNTKRDMIFQRFQKEKMQIESGNNNFSTTTITPHQEPTQKKRERDLSDYLCMHKHELVLEIAEIDAEIGLLSKKRRVVSGLIRDCQEQKLKPVKKETIEIVISDNENDYSDNENEYDDLWTINGFSN